MKLWSKLFLAILLIPHFTHASSLEPSPEVRGVMDKATSILKDKNTNSKNKFQNLFEEMKQVSSIGPKPCLEDRFPKAILLAQIYYREVCKGLMVSGMLKSFMDQLPEDIDPNDKEMLDFVAFSNAQREFFAKQQPFFAELEALVQPDVASAIYGLYEAQKEEVVEAMMLRLIGFNIQNSESPFYEFGALSFVLSCLSEIALKYPSKSELEDILSKHKITEVSATKSSELLAMYQDAQKAMQDHFDETKEVLCKQGAFSVLKSFVPNDPGYFLQILSR